MAKKILRCAAIVMTVWGAWHAGLSPAAAAEGAGHGSAAANPLTWDPDLAVFTAIVFLVLLAVLGKFAWRPLIAGLDQRERSIHAMVDEAKRGREEAALRLQLYEQQLAGVAAEAEAMVHQARREASAAGELLLAEARQQADRERQLALADIESAKNTAVREVASQSAHLAFALAGKIVQRELKPEDHAALVRESLEQLPSNN
ncbi:MAG: F0F1 ATP synthase subunit B [Planctomycetes bacterium]|nr:F0F1 ATP synthase subunit B [Planctomycetota bacterium]